MKLIILAIFSSLIFANDELTLFDDYLVKVKAGEVTKLNAANYVSIVEGELFKNISVLFDELQYSDLEINYISPTDKVKSFSSDWIKHIEENKLKKKLKQIIKNPKIALEDQSLQKLLKTNRKYSQIYRESFYIFDKDHTAPKKLQKVVKPFGKLNDAIVSQNTVLIEKYAAEVLSGIKGLNQEKILSEFQFIDKYEFNKFFKSIKEDVSKVLAKKSHSIHDFHWIRKQHKKFLVTYYHLDRYTPHSKVLILDDYLTKLGDLNDVYVDMKMRFKLDLSDYKLEIPKEIKKNMQNTLKYLEKDMRFIALAPGCEHYFKLR